MHAAVGHEELVDCPLLASRQQEVNADQARDNEHSGEHDPVGIFKLNLISIGDVTTHSSRRVLSQQYYLRSVCGYLCLYGVTCVGMWLPVPVWGYLYSRSATYLLLSYLRKLFAQCGYLCP